MNKNQSFRLAAVLYADNNYEFSMKTIHKKIIEAALLNHEKPISIHQLIEFIKNDYDLYFDEKEIADIVKNQKNKGFLIKPSRDSFIVCLTKERKELIKEKITRKNVDYFISEYEEEKGVKNVRDVIYRFLYEVLSSNIESFNKLIKHQQQDLAKEHIISTYSPADKEIINDFLGWDNAGKNQAIFDIASYALEYCMISNNNTGLQLNNLKNKIFYLDANVIFRALGINGDDRKARTITFLKKIVELNTGLLISKFSEEEFNKTINFYIDRLRRNQVRGKISPRIFQKKFFKHSSEIYDFYYKWAYKKSNMSLELFKAHILSLYEKFKDEYSITIDYRIPFDENEEKTQDQIRDIASNISSYKSSHNGFGLSNYNSHFVDASNIFLVETKRGDKYINIFDTKYFIISTDQYLRKWDYQRSTRTPIVILPSQWLSILLRYVNRTDDDYKSFVSFLNLPNADFVIESDKLNSILIGISEITQNFEEQEKLVEVLINESFKQILEGEEQNDEEIIERTKLFAETELDKKMRKMNSDQDKLKIDLENNSKKIESLESASRCTEKKLSQKEKENEILIQENEIVTKNNKLLIDRNVDSKFRKWECVGYLSLLGIILIVLFYYLQIFHTNWEYNYVEKFINFIDEIPSETKKEWLRSIANIGLSGVLVRLVFLFKNRILSDSKRQEKRNSIRKKIEEELYPTNNERQY